MQSNPGSHFIHPALTSFADECCATLARLIAYVGTLALFAIVGLHFWNQLGLDAAAAPADQPGFTLATRSRPAFAVSSLDPPEKQKVTPYSGIQPAVAKTPFTGARREKNRRPSSKSTAPAASSTPLSRRPPISPRAWRRNDPKKARKRSKPLA
jgi:hypothetical protein